MFRFHQITPEMFRSRYMVVLRIIWRKGYFVFFLLEIWLQGSGSGLGIFSDKGWLVQGLKGRDGSWRGDVTVEVCVHSLSVDCWLHGFSNGGGSGFKTKETSREALIPQIYQKKSTFTKLRFVFVVFPCVFNCLRRTMVVVVFCVTRTKSYPGKLLGIASKDLYIFGKIWFFLF